MSQSQGDRGWKRRGDGRIDGGDGGMVKSQRWKNRGNGGDGVEVKVIME